jgi:hypothetical protein
MKNSTQTVPNNANTTATFATVVRDDGGFTTPTANTLTVPTGDGGWYIVSGGACLNPATGGAGYIQIEVNGTPYPSGIVAPQQQMIAGYCASFGMTVFLNAADAVTMILYQYSGGGSLAMTSTFLGAVRVN